ncbi:MAG: folylpolyglutamate synthase/dihydrofolate synthase family protein [Bacillota bacterium]|nr:folylpolyglutamate synthase/dihydrofolate synthase family protein [Bacillota bacterium]
MTYEEALARIHEFERFGSRLGLERIRLLLKLLGNPQKDMKVIHVAGTNGKGSVCRFLYSVLQAHGFRTGLYISPFLERFTERIEFDGREISPEDLARCTEDVLKQVERMLAMGEESPTEFEVVTAIAFLYFSRKPVDFLVLEVGLGGRLDSTNVVEKPLASVITSIDRDHMAQLGDSLVEIAGEKAGIIKEGCPVVYRAGAPEAAREIRRIAGEKGSLCLDAAAGRARVLEEAPEGCRFTAEIGEERWPELSLSMGGLHQVENALTALQTLSLLQKQGLLRLEEEKLRKGLKAARQPGRFEILRREPWLILDGAHNAAGARSLADTAGRLFPGKKLLLVLGMLADKEVDAMLECFFRLEGELAATEPDSARRLPAAELCRRAEALGRPCRCLGSWQEACRYIEEHLNEYEVCVAAGSLYLIGAVRGVLKEHEQQKQQSLTDL